MASQSNPRGNGDVYLHHDEVCVCMCVHGCLLYHLMKHIPGVAWWSPGSRSRHNVLAQQCQHIKLCLVVSFAYLKREQGSFRGYWQTSTLPRVLCACVSSVHMAHQACFSWCGLIDQKWQKCMQVLVFVVSEIVPLCIVCQLPSCHRQRQHNYSISAEVSLACEWSVHPY